MAAETTVAGVSVRVLADVPAALVDDARGERPRADEIERDLVGDRREESRPATDDDRVSG
jgi:hypothetical protein